MSDSNDVIYEKAAYKDKSIQDIKEDLVTQGFYPLLIREEPNDSLAMHKHVESHILVQVKGDMIITSGGKDIHMQPGDKLTIPPNT